MEATAGRTIDPFSDEFRARPHEALAELRAGGWFAFSPFGLSILGYRQVHALARDPRLRSYGTFFIEMQGVTDGPLHEWWRRAPLHIDGDDHARIRRLVARAFTPRSVEALRPRIREIARELAEGLDGRQSFEFMDAFADPLPVRVICELLGVPDGDTDDFTEWARSLGIAFGFEIATYREQIEAAVVALYEYVDALVAERRRHPGEDLVSTLVQVEEAGERLSHDELQALIVALLFAGHDTTRNQLGCALMTFADHPGEWERLRRDLSLVPTAVEEVLRFEPAGAGTARLVADPFSFDGLDFEPGQIIELSALAANRDPEVFDDPHRFDVARRGEPPATFGGGVHYCLGAALARAELQEALPVLASRLPEFDVGRPVTWRPAGAIRGPERLEVEVTSAGRS